mmetsp:Transcript_30256/g.88110  ORF Transcript_30256/g.88110 Transcript_30256/m.88110 type:complete len:237 (-) Transcript_30256:31-741(-)
MPGLLQDAAAADGDAGVVRFLRGAPLHWLPPGGLQLLAAYQQQQRDLYQLMVKVGASRQAASMDVLGLVSSAVDLPRYDDNGVPGLLSRLFGVVPVGSLALRAVLRALPRGTTHGFDTEDQAAIRSWDAVADGKLVLHRLLDDLTKLRADRALLDAGGLPPASLAAAVLSWFRRHGELQNPQESTLCTSAATTLTRALQSPESLDAAALDTLLADLRASAGDLARHPPDRLQPTPR